MNQFNIKYNKTGVMINKPYDIKQHNAELAQTIVQFIQNKKNESSIINELNLIAQNKVTKFSILGSVFLFLDIINTIVFIVYFIFSNNIYWSIITLFIVLWIVCSFFVLFSFFTIKNFRKILKDPQGYFNYLKSILIKQYKRELYSKVIILGKIYLKNNISFKKYNNSVSSVKKQSKNLTNKNNI